MMLEPNRRKKAKSQTEAAVLPRYFADAQFLNDFPGYFGNSKQP